MGGGAVRREWPKVTRRYLSQSDCGRVAPRSCAACLTGTDPESEWRWAWENIDEREWRGDVLLSLSLDGCDVRELP